MKYPIGTKLMVCCIPGLDIPVEVTVRSFEYIIKDDSYVYILSNGLFIDEYHLEEILYKPKESKESKAQQYIWDYTKNCSNQLLFEDKDHNKYYEPWLTPDHALSAVQIAKEEFIERAIEWFNEVTQESDNGINIKFKCRADLINNFKKYVEV